LPMSDTFSVNISEKTYHSVAYFVNVGSKEHLNSKNFPSGLLLWYKLLHRAVKEA
jgi:hypothetical protein